MTLITNQEQEYLDFFNEHIDKAKKVKVCPLSSYIYLLYDEDELVYIGQTNISIEGRIGIHIKKKKFNSYKCLNLSGISQDKLNAMEAFLIYHLRPKLNVDLPPNEFYTKRNHKFIRKAELCLIP